MQVFLSPEESKGTPFRPVNGPKGNDTRIGIVGGGIGGIHMAYLLKKKGFSNVSVLEKTNRLGGLIDGVNVRGSKSTWHVWSWYTYERTLIPLLKQFGFESNMYNVTRDSFLLWPKNDDSVS